ncbi:MAG: hypothetical protein HYX53_13895 [Chloroflexi bacterium]|nr:hypothetical protein [Chloroflexota bacterium]
MKRSFVAVGGIIAVALALGLGTCGGGDDGPGLSAQVDDRSSEVDQFSSRVNDLSTRVAGLQAAAAAPPVDRGTPVPLPPFLDVEGPNVRAYFEAVQKIVQISGSTLVYNNASANAPLQDAIDNAFRKAEEVLHSSTDYITTSDRICVQALNDWARFATDYWNSLSRGAAERTPGRWTYAKGFEREVANTQQRWIEKCPQLAAVVTTTPSPTIS